MLFCPVHTDQAPVCSRGRQARLLPLVLLAAAVCLSGCARKYSVSVNQQVLYDPRPGASAVRMADAGLQSCINLLMRQQSGSNPAQIAVIACPNLEISDLGGIAALSALRFVDLAGNNLSNLDELRHLSSLSSVHAPDNQLQDISGILSTATLTSAVLTGNPAIPCDQLDVLQARLGQNLIRSQQCLR